MPLHRVTVTTVSKPSRKVGKTLTKGGFSSGDFGQDVSQQALRCPLVVEAAPSLIANVEAPDQVGQNCVI